MDRSPLALIEFPADEPERALRFWSELLDVKLEPREGAGGQGWQSRSELPLIGVHERGPRPCDTVSLPYFTVDDLRGALGLVEALGGTVIHPGETFAVCKDS